MTSYRVLPKTGPDHTVSYPIGTALARLLAAPAGSDERWRIFVEENAAGRMRNAVAGELITDLPDGSADALIANGDLELVVDAARATRKGGKA
jgi:hypothetical protein